MKKMKFKIGDKIIWNNVIREIVEVRSTGYTWRYPGDEPITLSNTWISENSNNPFFIYWKKIEEK